MYTRRGSESFSAGGSWGIERNGSIAETGALNCAVTCIPACSSPEESLMTIVVRRCSHPPARSAVTLRTRPAIGSPPERFGSVEQDLLPLCDPRRLADGNLD